MSNKEEEDSDQWHSNSDINRRRLLTAGAGAIATGVAGCLGGNSSGSGLAMDDIDEWPPTEYGNSITVWNWYNGWRDLAVEGFKKKYEDIENSTVDAYSNPGEFYAQIQNQHSIDSIGSTGEYTQRMMANDLAEPLPVEMMPAWDKIDQRFKDATMESYAKDGEVYALPTTIVVQPVIEYNEDYFDSAPDSYEILWEEDLADQILMWDRDYLLMQIAALYTGQDPHDPDDWDELEEVLIQQKDLNKTYFSNLETGQQLFANEEVVVGATSARVSIKTRAEKNDSINYTVPEEGTLYSLDQMVVPKGAPNPVAGAMFADYALSDESVRWWWDSGYSVTTVENSYEIISERTDNQELAEMSRWKDEWDLSPRVPLSEEVRKKTSELYTAVMGA